MMNRTLNHRVGAALLLTFVLSVAPTMGQSITADRPGFGDGASTLEQGTFQAELGYGFSQASSGFQLRNANGEPIGEDVDLATHEMGQLLLRYGITDAIELRGGVGSVAWQERITDPSTIDSSEDDYTTFESGYNGAAIGTKIRLLQTPTSTLSGVATLSLPLGTGAFDAADDRARQEVKLAFDGALGANLSVSLNGGASFFYDDGGDNPFTDREVEWLFFPSLGISATDALGVYVGYAGFYTDGINRSWVETGATYLLNTDTQVDVNTGLRVDDNIDSEFFLGLGLSHRF